MIRFEKRGLLKKETSTYWPAYTFKKTNYKWFIDLPEYVINGGHQEDLEMKEGAKELLNLLAAGRKVVSLQIDVEPFEGADTLELLRLCEAPKGGGWYSLKTLHHRDFNKEIWLCDVALFIFGDMPEKIYIKRLSSNII